MLVEKIRPTAAARVVAAAARVAAAAAAPVAAAVAVAVSMPMLVTVFLALLATTKPNENQLARVWVVIVVRMINFLVQGLQDIIYQLNKPFDVPKKVK